MYTNSKVGSATAAVAMELAVIERESKTEVHFPLRALFIIIGSCHPTSNSAKRIAHAGQHIRFPGEGLCSVLGRESSLALLGM